MTVPPGRSEPAPVLGAQSRGTSMPPGTSRQSSSPSSSPAPPVSQGQEPKGVPPPGPPSLLPLATNALPNGRLASCSDHVTSANLPYATYATNADDVCLACFRKGVMIKEETYYPHVQTLKLVARLPAPDFTQGWIHLCFLFQPIASIVNRVSPKNNAAQVQAQAAQNLQQAQAQAVKGNPPLPAQADANKVRVSLYIARSYSPH
ncbi:hypothetical protein BDK51DRAFT_52691 [Blyttiomyces helicus]|uniref:Uncharacterized protein n=1 Tax=Blyttiomyces helicus TaxID=388810 RepID=A0A4P9WJT0_9FUNG|nr:hypothetical protein BDK51DRAFT_52691 [Blyttiomyces helicus]|eukprot:RKO93209.1 hypothetical protein BDK51DRAFT_52691 [Blyttiomyces helicus]